MIIEPDATSGNSMIAVNYFIDKDKPVNELIKIPNNVIEAGKEYDISLGVYDVKDGVKIYFAVDGKEVVNYLHKLNEGAQPLVGKSGYFAMTKRDGIIKLMPTFANKEGLEQKINELKEMKQSIKIGSDYGQYPQEAVTEFEKAISDAQSIMDDDNASQMITDQMIKTLTFAASKLATAKINTKTLTSDAPVTLVYDLPESLFYVKNDSNVALKLDQTKKQPKIYVEAQRTLGTVKLEIPSGTSLSSSGWDGTFALPVIKTTPSGTFTMGQNFMAVTMGASGKVITSSDIVRIVLSGQKDKWLAYKTADGKYATIKKNDNLSEDSMTAAKEALANKDVAKLNVGNDMVIYTKVITEFLAYDFKAATDPDPDPNPNPDPDLNPAPSRPIGSGSSGSIGNPLPVIVSGKFKDIVGHWAEKDINTMVDKGIVSGVTENAFEPDRSITRAEFAALVARALNISTNESDQAFEDVSLSSWYAKDVAAAAKAGLIVGHNGTFRPDDLITREEMAIVIMKAYQHLGHDEQGGDLDKFTDKSEISSWAQSYVEQAIGAGLITGMTPNTFAPKENATRAQVVSLLNRLLDK